jgi:hypothetical protein
MTTRGPQMNEVYYWLAEQADARLTEVLKSKTGRNRWTMKAEDYKIPEVREALHAKYAADEVWLNFLRDSMSMTQNNS